jgi:hypothetical protein
MQGAAPLPLNLPIDFETGSYAFSDFDGGTAMVISNPFPSGLNTSTKVARIVRNGGATWAGSYLTLANKIDFTNGTSFSMKVYSPRAGMPVLFKLEGGQPTTEISVNTTIANGWETLTWNFAGKSSNLYNVLTFMFDFGAVGDGSANSTFLFDDIKLGNNSTNSLTVSSNVLTIASQANSTKTFDITSNSSWSLSCDQSWLTVSNGSGSGNGTITLTATVNPTIASRTATVTISGTGAGTQTITITQEGGTSGIGDIATEQFTIHPNPVSDILYLNTNFEVTGVAVFDIGGKLVFHNKLTENQINVSNLPNGIYTLKVELIKGFEVRKFIKQ